MKNMNEINLSKLITTILVIAIVIVGINGLLKINFTADNYKKEPTEIHNQLLKKKFLVNIVDINLNDSIADYVLVDLRNHYDFKNGHINNAINIFAPTILKKEHLNLIKKFGKDGKTIILYSNSPQESNSTWYILTKLGIENLKILNITVAFENNTLKLTPAETEIFNISIADYLKKSNEVKVEPKEIVAPVIKSKKIVPIKKEKIEIEEGGC